MILFFQKCNNYVLRYKITGDYLDFSWDKNLMIISKKVNLKNEKFS